MIEVGIVNLKFRFRVRREFYIASFETIIIVMCAYYLVRTFDSDSKIENIIPIYGYIRDTPNAKEERNDVNARPCFSSNVFDQTHKIILLPLTRVDDSQ